MQILILVFQLVVLTFSLILEKLFKLSVGNLILHFNLGEEVEDKLGESQHQLIAIYSGLLRNGRKVYDGHLIAHFECLVLQTESKSGKVHKYITFCT